MHASCIVLSISCFVLCTEGRNQEFISERRCFLPSLIPCLFFLSFSPLFLPFSLFPPLRIRAPSNPTKRILMEHCQLPPTEENDICCCRHVLWALKTPKMRLRSELDRKRILGVLEPEEHDCWLQMLYCFS